MADGFQFGVFSGVVALFVTDIWQPVKKHFGYCFKPGSNVRNLATEANTLKDKSDTINELILLGLGRTPRDSTIRWIQSARSIEHESSTIKNKYEQRSIDMFGCSWNCLFNYRIGRTAAKKKKKVDELNEVAPRNDSLFILLPPVGKVLPLPPNIVGQEKYIKDIVKYIREGTGRFIGIYGMGGAGKTTLLKQLNNIFSKAAELHEYDHVIYVEIGQQPNLYTVQHSIASQLGLTLGQDENTTARSASLYNFLKERKFLLLMDNLWQSVDLEEVGIPRDDGEEVGIPRDDGEIGHQNRQMIVITTRDNHTCCEMESPCYSIMLQTLNPEQAWSLFAANVGLDRLNSSSAPIISHAHSIAEKCGGLPLALKIVGKAMSSKKTEHDWKHALTLLQQFMYHQVPNARAESALYGVLYISYDQLPDNMTKQCFLLFALIAYRGCKYIPYTIDFWMGHGLLDEDDDILNSYLTGHSIIGYLKRACLLEEDPRGENYLRMHDTIRGLVLWIVQNKQGDGLNNNWLTCEGKETVKTKEFTTAHRISISSLGRVALYEPCRLLLTLLCTTRSLQKVPAGFFKIARSLTYLDLTGSNIQQLPSDLGELVNLHYLGLGQTPLQSIPMELQLLKSLRYLDLNTTLELKTIPDGIISALLMLRVLNLFKAGWGFPPQETQTHIEELKSLTCLQSLGFTVSDSDSLQMILDPSKPSLKFLCIEGMDGLPVLHITPTSFCKRRADELERLTLCSMESMKELSIGETIVDSNWHFKILDELTLFNIKALENIIWKGVVPHEFLPRLRLLMIVACHGIRAITWIKQLPCLEEAYVINCHLMLELVAGDAEGLTLSSFPRLKLLGLSCLPNLQNICDSKLAFPCLQRLLVYSCPKLGKLPSGLQQPEHAPLILSQQNFQAQLRWEDSSVKSALSLFFRVLPESFGGNYQDVYKALII